MSNAQPPRHGPDDVLATYESIGPAWSKGRDCSLFERPWLDRLITASRETSPGQSALDIGCGSGLPIASYLASQGFQVTGLDGAPSQLAGFQRNLPKANSNLGDMRAFNLARTFDLLISFNAFFHLSPSDQPRAIACFARHAAPGAALLLTTGPEAGERIGSVESHPIYHASLSPTDYRRLFLKNGFTELDFAPADPTCRGHTLWLLRRL